MHKGSRFLPDFVSGLVTGMVVLVFCSSLASLIFAGELSQHIPLGFTMLLLTMIVGGTVQALTSEFRSAITIPQERLAPVFATMAAGAVMIDTNAGPQGAAQVVGLLMATGLVTGILLWLIGRFRWGSLVRFFPFPVIGGVLAGLGWLLVVGALEMMAGIPLGAWDAWRLFQWDLLIHWLPGLAMALALLILPKRIRHWSAFLGLLGLSFAILYGGLAWAGLANEQGRQQGWFLGPFPDASGVLPWDVVVSGLTRMEPLAWLQHNWGSLGTIVVLSAVSILLTSSALELELGEDHDVNRELRSAGLASMASALAGGVVAVRASGISLLSMRMGAHGRLAGMTAVAVGIAALLIGPQVLVSLPTAFVAGLLLLLGLEYLYEWVWLGSRQLSRGDFFVVLVILVMTAVSGFLAAMAVGLVAALLLFVFTNSRVGVIRHILRGDKIRSHVERAPAQQRVLQQAGAEVLVLKLQNFLFFGTAHLIYQTVVDECLSDGRPPVKYIVIDFQQVIGQDSSALISFRKLAGFARRNGIALVFTHVDTGWIRRLWADRRWADAEVQIQTFADLDHGLEWVEERALDNREPDLSADKPGQVQQDDSPFHVLIGNRHFAAYLDPMDLEAGERLVREGDLSQDLFFIVSGKISAWVALDSGASLRVSSMTAGNVVGEIAWYLKQPRIASLVVDEKTRVLCLSGEALVRMARDDPALLGEFHQQMARMLASRLNATNGMLRAVLA